MPEDQNKTLSAHWQATPIPLAFRAGQFNTNEMGDIVQAVATWNDFFIESRGYPAFDIGDAGSPRQSTAARPVALCSNGIITNGQFKPGSAVTLYKQGSWPYANQPDAIALTSFCPVPAAPLSNIYMAMMEVNYQNFFINGAKLPDLQSIFTHELGHLLGLDHSCATANRVGFPNCNDSELPDAYFNAVMFPVVLFDDLGYGESRRALQSNDQGRANCLYEIAGS